MLLPWWCVMRVVPVLAFLAVTAFAVAAPAADRELPSAFFISKSENRNQVHYAVMIDDACRPVGDAPIRPYWRDLEISPEATSRLLPREQAAYGIASQSVISRDDGGGTIALSLRALPKRALRIKTGKDTNGACRAWTYTSISEQPAQLYNVHVTLKLLSIDSILLTGWASSDRRVVREKIER